MELRRFGAPALFLLALYSAARADPPPSDPAPDKSGISVSLAEKRKLRLVRLSAAAKGAPAMGLDGALEVTIANNGTSTIRLVPKHDVHGLVFHPSGGGAPFVMVHDCQCLHDAQSDRWDSHGLLRGRSKTVKLDEWGCAAGAWPPPPPGRYLVSYRTLIYPDPIPPSPRPSKQPPAELLDRCRKEIATDAYWKNALASNVIEITLAEPPPAKPRRSRRR